MTIKDMYVIADNEAKSFCQKEFEVGGSMFTSPHDYKHLWRETFIRPSVKACIEQFIIGGEDLVHSSYKWINLPDDMKAKLSGVFNLFISRQRIGDEKKIKITTLMRRVYGL